MTDNSYHGWTNRETWAANLWITNDQGLYYSALERLHDAQDVADEIDRDVDDKTNYYMLAGSLKDWWEELTDLREELMTAENILTMVRDIGDEDKIDWQEIAESLLSE
jgi:septation ring formation regulator EzrA